MFFHPLLILCSITIPAIDLTSVSPPNSIFSLKNLDSYDPLKVHDLGDINGDGIDDVIVATFPTTSEEGKNAGRIFVIYGNSSNFSDIDFSERRLTSAEGFTIYSDGANRQVGWFVSSAGDINKDGIDDIIIGTGDRTRSGNIGAYVIYGKDGGHANINLSSFSQDQGFRILRANNGNKLVYCEVSSAGDINNDTIDDILVSIKIQGQDRAILNKITTYGIYGSRTNPGDIDLDNLPSSNGFKIIQTYPGRIGDFLSAESLSWAGDVNQDGIDDFMVGVYGPIGILEVVYVIYGKDGGLSDINLETFTPSQGFKINGTYTTGLSLSYAGDINGDGISDVVIAGKDTDVYVIYGRAAGLSDIDLADLNTSQGFRIRGVDSMDRHARSVSHIGDLNKDGLDDILIGTAIPSDFYDDVELVGRSHVIFGHKGTFQDIDLAHPDNPRLLVVSSPTSKQWVGASTSSAGDLNNDGVDDFITAGKNNAYVIFGSDCEMYSECSPSIPRVCYASKGCACTEISQLAQDLSCVSSCSSGYYQSGGTCNVCSYLCRTCSSNSSCQICADGSLLQDTLCVSSCSPGYYQNGSTCNPSAPIIENQSRVTPDIAPIIEDQSSDTTVGIIVGIFTSILVVLIPVIIFILKKKKQNADNALKDEYVDVPLQQLDSESLVYAEKDQKEDNQAGRGEINYEDRAI